MSNARRSISAIALALCSLGLILASGASAAEPRMPVTSRAIIPVVAQVGSAVPAQRLVGATVKVYDRSATPGVGFAGITRGGPGPSVVGTATTGSRGVAMVRLTTNRAPR